jgi:hypothetical protein
VHRAGKQPLEELALPEDDHRLVANADGNVVEPLDRLARVDQPPQEERAPREQRPRDDEQRGERDRAYSRAFFSSAVIAGTISCRFPITA